MCIRDRRRTVEEKSGPNNDNWITRTETLFRGIVVRCKDICDPTLDIALNDMFQESFTGCLLSPKMTP